MRRIVLTAFLCWWSASTAWGQSTNEEGLKFFEQKIRPVLTQHCYSCHSQEAQTNKKLKADLFLDSALVIWSGEFGRTSNSQGDKGRDHNPNGFTIWLALV